jgi:PAS domain S-box-containing protein
MGERCGGFNVWPSFKAREVTLVKREYFDTLPAQELDGAASPEHTMCQLIEEPREHAIILLDPEGHVASWHDGAQASMGYEANEIIGAHLSRLYPAAAVACGCPELELRVALAEGRFAGEGWRVHRDGSCFWARILLMPLRDRDGRLCGFGYLTRDVPERKHAGALECTGAMNDFISRLANELRKPLAPIRRTVQLLRCKRLNDAELEVLYDTLDQDSAQLVALADDLLDSSRLLHERIGLLSEELDLGSVIARALEPSLPVIDARGQTLHVQLPEEAIRLKCDPVRLARVLESLLGNASRYTPDDGQIWLTIRPLGGQVQIRVRDSGIGMTPEFTAKAFDLFTQGECPKERQPAGLGVGLALARRVIALHGGSLGLRSDGLGTGSECLIHLPALEAASVAATASPAPQVTADGEVGRAVAGPRTRGAEASAAAKHDHHFVKPRHFGALYRLLRELASVKEASAALALPGSAVWE